MRLARFSQDSGPARTGLVVGDRILDVGVHCPTLPQDIPTLLGLGDSGRAPLARVAARAASDGMPLAEVRLHAPILPRKCLAVGLNYAAHAEEFSGKAPTFPTIFTKQVSCITGPQDAVQLPRVSDQLDYEGELVIVIGRRCRHVPRSRAPEVIGAYCVGNDFSVRDWQLRSGQYMIGKSFDTHGPIGPWVVTADELADPHDLRLRTWVNGALRQDGHTRDLLFDCFEIVSHLSAAMTLEPGDLIFTGTPSGVGFAMDPPHYLHAGDLVRVEIDGIGSIENRIVPEPDATAFIDA
jgi:2-keto-4-pentenoate hydratase/2-oxohepta-3-ene-1,7-dioic acid hydratase in catechol pathway